jgi:hypothetical protein
MKQIRDKKTFMMVTYQRMNFRQVYRYIADNMPKNSRWYVDTDTKRREYFWHYVNEYIGYKLCWIGA